MTSEVSTPLKCSAESEMLRPGGLARAAELSKPYSAARTAAAGSNTSPSPERAERGEGAEAAPDASAPDSEETGDPDPDPDGARPADVSN